MSKTIIVNRLHEQRENPTKKESIALCLEKGFLLETLNWNPKTEKTRTFNRYVLKSFKWKGNLLQAKFKKVDLKKEKKIKEKIIAKILKEKYDQLATSFLIATYNNMRFILESKSIPKEELAGAVTNAIKRSVSKKTEKSS